MASSEQRAVRARKRVTARMVGAAFAAALVLCGPRALAATPSPEYQLKASYLYHFTKFIRWPQGALPAGGGDFNLCVVGNDPFGKAIDAIAGKPAWDNTIRVSRHADASTAKSCHMVFIRVGGGAAQQAAIAELKRPGVLLIGEGEKFIDNGGILRFVTIQDKIRFEISESAATAANLEVGAKLLSVAIRKD